MIKKEIEGAALLSIYNELKDEIKAIRTDIQHLHIQQPQQSENNQELNSLLKETIVNAVNDTINAHINSRENYADEVSRRCKNTIDFAIERETKLVNNVLLPKLTPIIQINKKIDVMSAEEWISFRTKLNNIRYVNKYAAKGAKWTDDYETRLSKMGSVNYEYLNAFFQLAPVQNYSVAVANSSAKAKFRASVGYFDQKGVAIGTGYRRVSLRTNFESKVGKRITIGGNVTPIVSWN